MCRSGREVEFEQPTGGDEQRTASVTRPRFKPGFAKCIRRRTGRGIGGRPARNDVAAARRSRRRAPPKHADYTCIPPGLAVATRVVDAPRVRWVVVRVVHRDGGTAAPSTGWQRDRTADRLRRHDRRVLKSLVSRHRARVAAFFLTACMVVLGLFLGARTAVASATGPTSAEHASAALSPPLAPPLVVLRGFDLPPKPWLPGNRGVDLAANAGAPVFAAAPGVVRYAGELAGRGVVSIDHGGRLRTTYEPVDPVVRQGDTVTRGQLIGHLSDAVTRCVPDTCLHWGAIEAGSYVDPMKLLARRPAVRLLPIWSHGVPSTNDDRGGAFAAPDGRIGRSASRPSPGASAGASRTAPSVRRASSDTAKRRSRPPGEEAAAAGAMVLATGAVAVGALASRRGGATN